MRRSLTRPPHFIAAARLAQCASDDSPLSEKIVYNVSVTFRSETFPAVIIELRARPGKGT